MTYHLTSQLLGGATPPPGHSMAIFTADSTLTPSHVTRGTHVTIVIVAHADMPRMSAACGFTGARAGYSYSGSFGLLVS
jgi:hypothetical protein